MSILNYIYRFVRFFITATCFTIILTASIMFIWLSILPPVHIETDANVAINETQYVFAVFKESVKYALLLISLYFIAERCLLNAEMKSATFQNYKKARG
ncbi:MULTISPECIES: hypothetical protein [unclassified Pseudoalteromonas]|uniref:hypothetical protein n=1 Tax=unclassified Pseudoalteromonas TaxID=194690 RepID=UPI0016036085|nr:MULTISPECIES: hypothetical protein [unclassified Pseudoalteromonas]MBB1294959.1 hypothetical protein [Pseudoalteromonas sp. SR41-4]MBB1410880.1 hypothetical protein [Pseudoalteromonas sp. SG44-17]